MAIYTKSDSYTKLLIHSDTSDGNTSFVDSSANGHTITATSATHEDTQKKFGSTSMYFGGSIKYLVVAHHADFDFDGDFTIDFWTWQSAYGSQANNRFMQKGANQTDGWGIMTENGSHDVYFGRTDEELCKFTQDLRDSTWHHIAVTRQSDNKFRIYLDGVLKDTSSVYTDNLNDGGSLEFAKYPGDTTDRYAGYMDEIRISKGIARWTSNFTPPNKPYDVINTDTQTSDSKEDSAFEVDGGGNAQFGSSIIVRSDPTDSDYNSVFSVSKNDGTELLNVAESGVLESGMLKVDAEGAVQVYNPHAGIYMTSFSDTFAIDEVKNIQMKTNVNVFGSMFINVTGNYGSTNAIGAYEKCFSVGVNSVNTGIYSAGSSTIVDTGGTEAHFAFGTPVKPDAVTYNIPVTNRSGTYAIDFYINVVFKGYISGIISIKLV